MCRRRKHCFQVNRFFRSNNNCTLTNRSINRIFFFGCSLWWPFFVFAFYILSIFPTILAKRSESRARIDLSIFLTVGFVLSSFYLPIVMARSHTVRLICSKLTKRGAFTLSFILFTDFMGSLLLNNYW